MDQSTFVMMVLSVSAKVESVVKALAGCKDVVRTKQDVIMLRSKIAVILFVIIISFNSFPSSHFDFKV